MGFAVKVNSISKARKIHRADCYEVRKRWGVWVHRQVE